MVTKKDRALNRALVKKLVKEKNWQVDWERVNQAIEKPHPRFLYFPVVGENGQSLFFKSCSWGRLELRKRIIKEYEIQKWLRGKGGPVKKIVEFGQEGPIFWYTSLDFPLSQGIICQEEDVKDLKTENITILGAELKKIWAIKKEQVPPGLFSLLAVSDETGKIYPIVYQKVLRYLKFLRKALTVSSLNWKKQDEKAVVAFFNQLKSQALSFENKEGLFIHGDLSPNNIFFTPKSITLFDWESAWWSRNILMDAGIDLANFYTRCWLKPELGERLIKTMWDTPLAQKKFFPTALRVGMVITVLQKISPMTRQEIYQKKYDQEHINWLIEVLRKNLEKSSALF